MRGQTTFLVSVKWLWLPSQPTKSALNCQIHAQQCTKTYLSVICCFNDCFKNQILWVTNRIQVKIQTWSCVGAIFIVAK